VRRFGDLLQVGLPVRRLAEGADRRHRQADRVQALAADVADDHAQPVLGLDGVVEVPADAGRLGRRHVGHCQGDPAQRRRQRSEDRPAGSVGGALHGEQVRLAALPAVGCEGAQADSRSDAGEPDVLRRGGAVVAGESDRQAGQPGGQAEDEHPDDAGEGRGEERHGGEQPDVLGLLGAGCDVGGHDAGRQGQARGHARPWRALLGSHVVLSAVRRKGGAL